MSYMGSRSASVGMHGHGLIKLPCCSGDFWFDWGEICEGPRVSPPKIFFKIKRSILV